MYKKIHCSLLLKIAKPLKMHVIFKCCVFPTHYASKHPSWREIHDFPFLFSNINMLYRPKL